MMMCLPIYWSRPLTAHMGRINECIHAQHGIRADICMRAHTQPWHTHTMNAVRTWHVSHTCMRTRQSIHTRIIAHIRSYKHTHKYTNTYYANSHKTNAYIYADRLTQRQINIHSYIPKTAYITYIHIHVQPFMHARTHATLRCRLHTCHTYTHTHHPTTYIHASHTRVYVSVCIYIYIYIYICVWGCVGVCLDACMHACMHERMNLLRARLQILTKMHEAQYTHMHYIHSTHASHMHTGLHK